MSKLRENRSILQKSIIFLFIFVFIVAYFLFLTHIYIKPNRFFDRMPFLLYIGFAIIIVVFFSFMIFELDNENKKLLKFRFLSENSIKVILMIFMSITIFIPPISFSTTIIDWNQVGILNYFRAISFLIGCLFLPGANLFKIFFPKNTLHERFKVEPFIIKITLYPLLSLIFLGLSVLILDQIGFLRESITIILFLLIFGLFFSDFIIQKLRNNKIEMYITEINISKYTFMILVIAFAVILISLGIGINAKYLVPGDSWRGISSAIYIGTSDPSPINSRYYYAIFWGFISFGLSILSGLPYINTNVMLTPFCYLSVFSIYLFIKAILYDYKEKYSVLASILIITFSSLTYTTGLGVENTSPLIQDFVFFFRFKSYALFLLFSSLALFFIISKTNKPSSFKTKHRLKTEDFKIIILGALFLIYSSIIYFLPLLAGFFLIFLYCLFSDKKKHNFRIFFHFIFFLFLFFIFFDVLTNFFLSDHLLIQINRFFIIAPNLVDIPKNIRGFLINFILGTIIIFYIIFQILYIKYYNPKKESKHRKNLPQKKFLKSKIRSRIKINPKIIFISFLIIFSLFLIIEIHNIILDKFFSDYNLGEKDFFAFYINLIFVNIGFIGILAIYLSYFCFKTNKKTFYVLISWILTSLILASLLIFKTYFIDYPFTIPQDISSRDYHMMTYWFSRVWYYSIPAFSVISSIGLIFLMKKRKKIYLIKKRILRKIFDLSSISILISLSFSSFILGGMYWACTYKSGYSGFSDSEAQIVGWISENLPKNSKILIDSHNMRYIRKITEMSTFFIWEEINNILDKLKLDIDYELDNLCNLSILDDYNGEKNVLKLEDNNQTGRIFMLFNFKNAPQYGRIAFLMKTTNSSKSSFITLNNDAITIEIRENGLYYHNNTNAFKITNIENDYWYYIKIYFTSTNNTYKNLNQFQWKIIINGTGHGPYDFGNNNTEINYLKFYTSFEDSNWTMYFNNMKFSWISGITDIKKYIFKHLLIIDDLKSKNFTYYIHFDDININSKIKEKIDVEKEIIEGFYNNLLYRYKNISLYAST